MRNYTFIHPDPELKNNLMAFGLECGPGWFPKIEEYFDKIQDYIDESDEEILMELLQVKEKYGTLRAYYYGGDDWIEHLVDELTDACDNICENCGKSPARLVVDRGWYMTRCADCFHEENNK